MHEDTSLRRVESVKTVINSRSTTPRDALSSCVGCVYVLRELLRQIRTYIVRSLMVKECIFFIDLPNTLNDSSHRRGVDCFCQHSRRSVADKLLLIEGLQSCLHTCARVQLTKVVTVCRAIISGTQRRFHSTQATSFRRKRHT